MNITVLYVGSSLLAPLKQAEREINREHALGLRVAAYNFGASLTEDEWREVEGDLSAADVIFVIHVMDGENAARLLDALERHKTRHHAVVVINCMPKLMRRTRMGSRTSTSGASVMAAPPEPHRGVQEAGHCHFPRCRAGGSRKFYATGFT